jgi:NTE family protein
VSCRSLETVRSVTWRKGHRLRLRLLFAVAGTLASSLSFAQERATVGVAFGGGSARGIAHVGVIRWFEEHRIPIDMAAGTSMGGLIGGSFATGMDAAAIHAMLRGIDWDEMFGFSSYAFKNIRRKADARAYPSRLEFGIKKGIVLPPSLNNGQQVDLLITGITAPYFAEATFATLPTPFKVVAVDLRTAEAVVLDRGSLARALRATMSLPGIFPPVELDGQVLVDGGAMNNVPADVVRAMGADTVIAINVGDLDDQEDIDYSIFGLAGATIDAMMRANTKTALKAADVVLNIPLKDYGSLAWRQSDALIEEGYKAAEAMKDTLLRYAISETAWRQWQAHRVSARKVSTPPPAFVVLEGVSGGDERRMNELLAKHTGARLDIPALDHDLEELSGLDRYESITWQFAADAAGDVGLAISAIEKPYAPPFLMLGVNLENTTSDQFQLSLAGRYLRFDVLGSGSELRLDAVVGADPSVGAALYEPIWRALFVVPHAGISTRTFNLFDDDEIVARYSQTVSKVGADVGVNLGRDSDLRLGATIGRLEASAKIGDPGLPAVAGKETEGHLTWRVDTHDSATIPSRGTLARATFGYVFDSPDLTVDDVALTTTRRSVGLPQLAGEANRFWRKGERTRLFVLGGAGTSFDHQPLPVDQFPLGSPMHLGAYGVGEIRGDHYLIATAGILRELGRMPDFLGGPIFAGTWIENGDAFDHWGEATLRTHLSGGVILDTLVGPMILAGSAGFDGRWRTYLGIGRLFR